MNHEYELINHSKIKHLHSFVINITYRNFHMHNDFELLLILKGTGHIRIKSDNFAVCPSDIVLINPNEMHEIDAREESLDFVILQVSRHFLNHYFPLLRNTRFGASFLRPHFSPDAYSDFIQTLIRFSKTYLNNVDFYTLECVRNTIDIIESLYRNLPYEVLDENTYREHKKRHDRINRIAAYIDENYLYPIRLKDIAEQENISITHLSHFFTDNFQVTFQEYLTETRLRHALLLMESNNYSLAALSELSGFSDPKYLNKAFLQKFGYPFREYKKSVFCQSENRTTKHAQALQYYYSTEESLEILETLA